MARLLALLSCRLLRIGSILVSYVFDPARALRDMDLVEQWIAEIKEIRNEQLDDIEMDV